MLSTGSTCINQAVKAIAIARGGGRSGCLQKAHANAAGLAGNCCTSPDPPACNTHTHHPPNSPTTPKGYLANDGHDLTFQTAFREGGTPEKPSVALYMAKHPLGWPITPNNVEMQVRMAVIVCLCLSGLCVVFGD